MILFLSMGSQVVSAGSDDISGFSWDESTVGVGNETSNSCCVVWGWETSWGNKGSSFGGQVCSAGSDNICGFSWDKSTVGVGNETSESCSVVWGWETCWGNEGSSMGGQVCSAGSDNISGLSWDYGTVGVSNECWGIRVSISTSIWVSSISSSISVSTTISTTIWVSSICSSVTCSPQTVIGTPWEGTLGGKVSGLSGLDLWGLDWGNCTVGVGDELSAGNSHACEENQEFHVYN
jgi:hypothetical protein